MELCASVKDNDPTENNGQKNRKSKPFWQVTKDIETIQQTDNE